MALRQDRHRPVKKESRLKRLFYILIPFALLITWALVHRAAPAEVPFAKIMRDNIESSLTTNGKVEPIQFATLRAERAGAVDRVLVQRGDSVKKGQLLAEMDSSEAHAELAGAAARIAGARAEAQVTATGGRAIDRTQIEN